LRILRAGLIQASKVVFYSLFVCSRTAQLSGKIAAFPVLLMASAAVRFDVAQAVSGPGQPVTLRAFSPGRCVPGLIAPNPGRVAILTTDPPDHSAHLMDRMKLLVSVKRGPAFRKVPSF
jgi:hypothetical protein